jgi:hypothetical protein
MELTIVPLRCLYVRSSNASPPPCLRAASKAPGAFLLVQAARALIKGGAAGIMG